MSSTIEWQVWCETDSKFVRGISYKTEGRPTICYDNNTHTITTTIESSKAPSIIKENSMNYHTIDEGELTKTGKFNLTHIESDILDTAPGTITTFTKQWDYPVSASAVSYDVTAAMKGDKLAMYFNKFVTIGLLTADLAVPTAWVAQNYVAGDAVTYNNYTYTCIGNTITNDTPRIATTGLVNSDYWRKGLRLSVPNSIIERVNDGYMAKITDGTNSAYLGEIWYVDAVNNYLYVGNKHTSDTPITNSYLAATPTYFQTGYQAIGDVENGPLTLNESGRQDYGTSKIGGAYLLEETIISIEYTNVDGAAGKHFIGNVEITRGSGPTR